MAFVPFNNVMKLEARFSFDSQAVENVHYFMVDETPSVDTSTTLAASYVDWWNTNIKSLVSSNVILYQVVVTIMENENDPSIVYTTGLPISGTAGFDMLPNNCAVVISWKTALRGRSYRGRTYHIGVSENMATNSYLTTAAQTALKNAYLALLALDTNVGPGVLVIASRVHNGVERTTGVATLVDTCSVDTTIDSQRRRLPGRGR